MEALKNFKTFGSLDSLIDITENDIEITPPKNKSTSTNGITIYFVSIKGKTIFTFSENINIIGKMAPQSEEKFLNTEKKSINTTISECGKLGPVLLNLEECLKKAITKALQDKIIKGSPNKAISTFIRRTYSENSNDASKANTAYPSPWITFTYKTGLYPKNYSNTQLSSTPKSKILDYSRTVVETKDKKLVKTFLPAKVKNEKGEEEDININNIHLFITPGTIIRSGRITINSISVSATKVSCQILLSMAIVDRSMTLMDFSDEYEEIHEGLDDLTISKNDNESKTDEIDEKVNELLTDD